ncbi:DUF2267 domain-containing protein [Actinomadura scrupuli]|uniref:DUF2267 domain-containing protein n=1 Tax=Actinomadura scrupuli TaxID=559629 RepID=UPI003D9607A3
MICTRVDSLDHSIETTNRWLNDLATELKVSDRRAAYQALRGWLHTLRDRLTVEVAAHFAAQLPELLRGVFYDGWMPSRVPVKYDPDEYLERFIHEANLRTTDAVTPLRAVTRCVRRHTSAGTVDRAFGQLPTSVRALLDDPVPAAKG